MDKPSFARKSPPAKANHTDGGDRLIRPAIAPAENGDLEEIKSAVLAKLALELGKDASVATDRDWFVAAALTIRDRRVPSNYKSSIAEAYVPRAVPSSVVAKRGEFSLSSKVLGR